MYVYMHITSFIVILYVSTTRFNYCVEDVGRDRGKVAWVQLLRKNSIDIILRDFYFWGSIQFIGRSFNWNK